LKIKNKIIQIIIFTFSFLLIGISPIDTHSAKKKTSSTSSSSKKGKPKGKKKKRKSAQIIKRVAPNSHIFIKDTLLSSGITYKQLYVTINGLKHCVNILQVDLLNNKAGVGVFKGGNNITELERLPELLSNYGLDTSKMEIAGGINGNFWRAYTNYPIGPTVINGEIAEMQSYKKWTSTLFNEDGVPFMNFYSIQGELITNSGNRINIRSANRRSDSNGIVVYNKFGGDVIPYINSKKAQELLVAGLDNVFQEQYAEDSTESVESLVSQKEELLNAERASSIEYDLKKLIINYIDSPAVNNFIKARVVDIVSGSAKMPTFGCILSIGDDIDSSQIPKIGDEINLHYWTNINESEVFTNAVCGTPRLVRDGIARHEAYEEGSKKKQFINGALPRTAIGYNKEKTKFFMVAVTGKKQDGAIGASLSQMAEIMEYIGCYSAQNLDGGGSTNMVISNDNIINPGGSRKLSVALAAINYKQERASTKLPQRKKIRK
jgi:hypothetical protein